MVLLPFFARRSVFFSSRYRNFDRIRRTNQFDVGTKKKINVGFSHIFMTITYEELN